MFASAKGFLRTDVVKGEELKLELLGSLIDRFSNLWTSWCVCGVFFLNITSLSDFQEHSLYSLRLGLHYIVWKRLWRDINLKCSKSWNASNLASFSSMWMNGPTSTFTPGALQNSHEGVQLWCLPVRGLMSKNPCMPLGFQSPEILKDRGAHRRMLVGCLPCYLLVVEWEQSTVGY